MQSAGNARRIGNLHFPGNAQMVTKGKHRRSFRFCRREVLYYSGILILLTGCTLSTTWTKNPVFRPDWDTLSSRLKNLVVCENIIIQGKMKKTGGQTFSELTVRLVNGKNLPGDQGKRNEIGKEIAILLKQSLKNPDDFDSYMVLFVNQQIHGPLSKSSYMGRTFRREELDPPK
jgi:hypothetical protein